jgi:hypothetical protein
MTDSEKKNSKSIERETKEDEQYDSDIGVSLMMDN